MVVTKHASKRIRERIGINKKSVNRIAELAIYKGIQHKETSGRLKKYLDFIYSQHQTSANVRIYNQKVFIFDTDFILITVLQIPQDLVSAVNKITKRKKNN